jgi:hypothetical protein
MALAVKHFTVTAQGAGQGSTGIHECSSIQIRESNGAPAVAEVTLREGGAAGTQRVFIELAANESQVITFDHPIVASSGDGFWYYDVDAGVVDLTVSGRA